MSERWLVRAEPRRSLSVEMWAESWSRPSVAWMVRLPKSSERTPTRSSVPAVERTRRATSTLLRAAAESVATVDELVWMLVWVPVWQEDEALFVPGSEKNGAAGGTAVGRGMVLVAVLSEIGVVRDGDEVSADEVSVDAAAGVTLVLSVEEERFPEKEEPPWVGSLSSAV